VSVEILLDEKGNTVHARVFRPAEVRAVMSRTVPLRASYAITHALQRTGPVKLHSIHNRVQEEGGAIFSMDEEITYFET
jgi:hypothetical protein